MNKKVQNDIFIEKIANWLNYQIEVNYKGDYDWEQINTKEFIEKIQDEGNNPAEVFEILERGGVYNTCFAVYRKGKQ